MGTAARFRVAARQIKESVGVFIAVSAGIEVLLIAPRLEERQERGKQLVTVRVSGGVSGWDQEIDRIRVSNAPCCAVSFSGELGL